MIKKKQKLPTRWVLQQERRGSSTNTTHLALDERSEQDEDGDAGPHDEVDEVPEGQAAHLPQGHLLHLQAQPVPLVPQRALEAHQHDLQGCDDNNWRVTTMCKVVNNTRST